MAGYLCLSFGINFSFLYIFFFLGHQVSGFSINRNCLLLRSSSMSEFGNKIIWDKTVALRGPPNLPQLQGLYLNYSKDTE